MYTIYSLKREKTPAGWSGVFSVESWESILKKK